MRVLLYNFYTEREQYLEGHPRMVARQLCVRLPYLGRATRRRPVGELLAEVNRQQYLAAVVLEGGDGLDGTTGRAVP